MHIFPIKTYVKRFLILFLLFFSVSVSADTQMQPTIRVLLRRSGITDAIQIQIHGNYMLDDGSMTFRDGTKLMIVLRENRLVIHTQEMAIVMGEELKLVRCGNETDCALGLSENEGLYEGDLALSVDEERIEPILYMDIEDYVAGVVPYEMGDSFPLEALKAQAIAARTYALRKSNPSRSYDVEDTTNDQAFRGRTTKSPVSEQAVRETAGQLGTYRGSLAQCYYSASNGGQTELGQHVWPTADPQAYGYMDMRDDPYDLENSASIVKRYTVQKNPGKAGIGTELHDVLIAALSEQLTKMGYDAKPDLVRIDRVESLKAVTPKYDGDSRLMTQLQFTLKLSARHYLSNVHEQASSTTGPIRTEDTTPQPTQTPAYSAYKALDTPFEIVIPIFPDAERAMGLSISVTSNELISVTDAGSAFIIESRRFGHGVGMSQRGAQQMAQKYKKTYREILAFYYPGMDIVTHTFERTPHPTANMALMSTPAPTPSPTPRPTLMPVTGKNLKRSEYMAIVAEIDENSSLNLRASPSLSSDVLKRLFKDQKLIVQHVSSDGWAQVRTDDIAGYVRSEYLKRIDTK